MIGLLTPVTYLMGGRFYRSIGFLVRRYSGLCWPEEEGIFWCRGWSGKRVAALRVVHALRAATVVHDESPLPPGWTSSTYAFRFGP